MKLLIALAPLTALLGQTPETCLDHRRHGRKDDASRCFASLIRSADPYVRAEGFWGIGQHQQANNEFRSAVARDAKNPQVRVRWGRLYLERHQKDDAVQLFQEALEIKKDYPPALVGLALVASESFESKAVELAESALKQDPRLLEAQELLARLALEDGNEAKAAAEADKALAMSPEALDAMAVRAAIEWLNDRPGADWLTRIFKVNPRYGEAYALAGHLFVINRRYEEGIAMYRKAVELNPDLWAARSELGVNLMRLGREDEAREQLEFCYRGGFQDAATVNSLRLMDSYKNFVAARTPRGVLRLHKKEAELLRPYFEEELERAVRTFDQKYRFKLDRPVSIEVYPDHEDFAVRTLGLPGLGALGVTFGYVIAMDSPSARKPGSFHWASTLWHELSHVYVLAATNHRVPRWFTEGMAVHEETAISPDWGDRLDPQVIQALKDKKLLPVAQLDRGFIRPSYPAQVVVSYFQAGRICDYISGRWGYDKLLAMMHAFGRKQTTPQVIEEELGIKPEEFDKAFFAWLDAQTKKTVDGFEEWRKRLRGVAESFKAKKFDEVIREGSAIRDVYPDYVEAGSVYEFLADAYLDQGDKPNATHQLEAYSKAGGRNPATIKRLAALLVEQGRKKEAAQALNRLIFVYPVEDEELHQRLGELWLEGGNTAGAVREFRAIVAGKPLDPAAGYYNLARAQRAAGRTEEAKESVLLSLEAAPGFRPAQKLLLELSK